MSQNCPLCNGTQVYTYQERPFLICESCHLLFKDSTEHLNKDNEKARYLLHTNSISDIQYVNFLMPVVNDICQQLEASLKGLDYGSGPQPVLAELLTTKGYTTDIYDPFFAPRSLQKINNEYDFITCTETAEHFYKPAIEFEQIFRILKAKGYLFLMTKLYTPETNIKTWDYARDSSHVCFYSFKTLQWLATKYSRNLVVVNERLFRFEAQPL